ncbi:hypothetical protein R0290_17530 [Burkholderia semiarida]|uniref:hypothetical protein n=1 Tax=Burkholderia sp. AU44665 TaxID=3059203 RepID=UPI00265FF41C|nr:hypothetical protein [Burkholderia sp. AU44665]MDN7699122.1 hypothetical protein [Burkholderia sp. AU44665]
MTIHAGDGGFDINVKGNTDLKGAYIASTATPDKNQLTTGTLSFSDIQNSSGYNASSFGISAGGGVGDGGVQYILPGSIGRFVNQFIQFLLGPIQSAIEAAKNKPTDR